MEATCYCYLCHSGLPFPLPDCLFEDHLLAREDRSQMKSLSRSALLWLVDTAPFPTAGPLSVWVLL